MSGYGMKMDYQYEVGQMVRVREDLVVGRYYLSGSARTRNSFAETMVEFQGRIAHIVDRQFGQYILDIDPDHRYTDTMLRDLLNEHDGGFAQMPYRYNEEVEEAIHASYIAQLLTALDQALDERLFETDPEAFQQIVDLMS